ncbi:hypothetical protein L6452_20450 [Arctium lappa]|uniref:Uncharacterized protein n=1 Tax=Arctium lappa TaxID=4217 RepID=A0ACB9BBV1_ARCLA|nr:hypothetical protein L6452_20450 [Arctium lappa]
MSVRAIVKTLTDTDTSYNGVIILPKNSTEEHFISYMDESLRRIVFEEKEALEVLLYSEASGFTGTVVFTKYRDTFMFKKCSNFFKASNLKTGDKVEFYLRGIVGKSMHVEFQQIRSV